MKRPPKRERIEATEADPEVIVLRELQLLNDWVELGAFSSHLHGTREKFRWRVRGYDKFLDLIKVLPCVTTKKGPEGNHLLKLNVTLKAEFFEYLRSFNTLS